MCEKFCIYKKLYIFVRSIRHNIKKKRYENYYLFKPNFKI